MAERQGRSPFARRSAGRLTLVAWSLALMAAGVGPTHAATTNAAASPAWSADTSATQLPASFQGDDFFRVFDQASASGPKRTGSETRSRSIFRLDQGVDLVYEPDSQTITCRIDLRPAQITDPGFAAGRAIVLHMNIHRGRTFSARDARGMSVQIQAGNRDVQGVLLVTRQGDLARRPPAFDRTIPVHGPLDSASRSGLRAYAVCRVTPLSGDRRTVIDQESYTEPRPGLPVRLHNRFRYVCVNVASVWIVDSATGVIVHKEAFDVQP